MLEASHLLWTPAHLGLPSWMALGVWLAGKMLESVNMLSGATFGFLHCRQYQFKTT